MPQKKKILFLIPTLFRGGAERVISEVSLALPESMEPVIVVFEKKISYPYRGKLISLDSPISKNLFSRFFRFFVRWLRFLKVLAQEKPDCVVSAGASANAISILAHPRSVVRVDMHISGSRKGWRQLPFKLFVRFFFKKAHLLVAVSKAIALDLEKNFRIPAEKIRVIYNPVNVAKLQALAQEPLGPEYESLFASPVIIAMGRLEKQKAHGKLLRAFTQVKKKIPQAQLVLLGEGSLKDSLQELSHELGIQDSVHFLGWQENPFRFLARAKVFALSSLWEGLPDVLLEALACGLPIVSFDCKSGPREILAPSTPITKQATGIEAGEYGLLVQATDEELLAKAIADLLTDSVQLAELSRKARQRAFDFDIKKVLAQWDFL
ncbi:MAG: glycosyltransferase [Parcubacteria group bacterium]|nr:glycosyltransferase [Parcubacteria group bacterium]